MVNAPAEGLNQGILRKQSRFDFRTFFENDLIAEKFVYCQRRLFFCRKRYKISSKFSEKINLGRACYEMSFFEHKRRNYF